MLIVSMAAGLPGCASSRDDEHVDMCGAERATTLPWRSSRFIPTRSSVRLPRSSHRHSAHMPGSQLGPWRYASVLLSVPAMLFLLSCAAAAQGRAVSCPIIAGGGAIRVRDYEVVFSAANERTESTLRGLVIVRASADVRRRHPSGSAAERWAVARPRHPGSGANVGSVMIVH